jgi:polysaccharide export outer membrane protein
VFIVAVRWLLVATVLFVGCSRGSYTANSAPAAAPHEDTTLGPGDVFEVRVFGQPDMSGKHQVGPDGTVQFPFLGSVMAAGREPQEIAAAISKGLKEGNYLVDPQVSVFVEQTNSKRISVLGAVAKPGTFPIIPGMTVVQAVSQAGGFTALASKDDTVVTRRTNDKVERYRVQISAITRGDAEDFLLRPGDIVFVPERVF